MVVVGILLAGPLVCATSQAVNDWFDRHVDAINEPHRPIPSGRMPDRWGLYIAIAWTVLALGVAVVLGPWGFGAAAIGGNCGNGPDEILSVIEKMHAASPQTVLIAKANAGLPTLVNGRAVYAASPESMAEYARAAAECGARIVGACCGSTPAHLRAMAEALQDRLAA
jgi:hypothetical protein